jgi:hypothetical protein
MKNGSISEPNEQDAARYRALIEDCLSRFKKARKEMQKSKVEIERLKASSRRKLAQIDAVLSRV